MNIIKKIIAYPGTADLSVDDPQTTQLRLDIIQNKSFLKKIYDEWYQLISAGLSNKHQVLELGSGAGFFSELLPDLISSEIFVTPNIKLVADACQLPLQKNSLDAIVMTDVFHHIPNVEDFFAEASRCVKPGGKLIMIEPWNTPWSKWVYTNLHHEPFETNSNWKIPDTGPLSSANGALPWIVFKRDQSLFYKKFPQWSIINVKPMMPISYLLSGGVSLRSFVPGHLYALIRFIEKILLQDKWAMFALIELEQKQLSSSIK